jgi:hypothetical protein
MVSVAHANDGGGSIRIPASECGLVGLKPSRGRVSLGPLLGDAWHGLAIEGVVCRSVRDSAGVLDAIAGAMPGDPYAAPVQNCPFVQEVGADPGKLRIGMMKRTPQGSAPLHPDCVAAVEEPARLLESLGHHVEQSHPGALDEADFAGFFTDVVASHTVAALDQIGTLLGRKLNAEDVELWTWQMASRGFGLSAAQYLIAINWLQLWSRRVAQWWSNGFDLLLTPTIAEPPVPLGTFVAHPEHPSKGFSRLMKAIPFTPPYNVTGQPAISLPLTWNAEGLPTGSQLVAAFGREDLLIRIAAQLEQAHPWSERKPPDQKAAARSSDICARLVQLVEQALGRHHREWLPPFYRRWRPSGVSARTHHLSLRQARRSGRFHLASPGLVQSGTAGACGDSLLSAGRGLKLHRQGFSLEAIAVSTSTSVEQVREWIAEEQQRKSAAERCQAVRQDLRTLRRGHPVTLYTRTMNLYQHVICPHKKT